jgi:hypothetical protein
LGKPLWIPITYEQALLPSTLYLSHSLSWMIVPFCCISARISPSSAIDSICASETPAAEPRFFVMVMLVPEPGLTNVAARFVSLVTVLTAANFLIVELAAVTYRD